jgi:hypothetical protein
MYGCFDPLKAIRQNVCSRISLSISSSLILGNLNTMELPQRTMIAYALWDYKFCHL